MTLIINITFMDMCVFEGIGSICVCLSVYACVCSCIHMCESGVFAYVYIRMCVCVLCVAHGHN